MNGLRYFKHEDHSLLVTETGTGLRVSMLPGGGLGQQSSLIAPSSGGGGNVGRELLMSVSNTNELYSQDKYRGNSGTKKGGGSTVESQRKTLMYNPPLLQE